MLNDADWRVDSGCMLTRGLISLALLLGLALAPAAMAEPEPVTEDPAGCIPPDDADADNVSEEDLCAPAGGEDDGAAACEPGAGEPPVEEGEDVELEEEGEAGAPSEAAPEYRDFCEPPAFDPGFLRRAWRFNGDAAGFSGGVLKLTISGIPGVPAAFREQADALVGLEVAVVVGSRTRLEPARAARGSRRKRARRVTGRTLQRAGRVRVAGKLLAPERWRTDADGRRVPTVRATRIALG